MTDYDRDAFYTFDAYGYNDYPFYDDKTDLVLRKMLLTHFATNVPENDVDSSAGQSLQFGVVFMLTDSCQ